MDEIDKYYQILGLDPGASEEEIKQAYRDLVKVWHPDRFLNNPRLQEKANEKLRDINDAYQKLKSYIAGEEEQYTASEERENHAKSQPPPHEPPPEWEKEQSSTTESRGYEEPKPSPDEPPEVRIWNPNAAANWSILFTPAFGSYLQMLNWRTLNEPAKASSAQSWFHTNLVMLFIYFLIGMFMIDPKAETYWPGFLYLIHLMTWYFAAGRSQDKYVKAKFGRNYPKRPLGQALLIAVGALIGCWVVTFGLGFIFRAVTSKDNIHTASVPPSSAPAGGDSTEAPEKGLSAVDWYNKGHSFLSSGNHRNAVIAFNRAIELNTQFEEAYAYRGRAYYELSDFEQAIRDCSKAIELNLKGAMAYYYRGSSFFMIRQFDKAINDLNKAISNDPNDGKAYAARGAAFCMAERYAEAITDLDKAISVDPNHSGVDYSYYYRGWAFLRKRQLEEALGDFNKAISINPSVAAFYRGRGFTKYMKGQYDIAVEDFGQAIRIDPNDPGIYYTRGYAHLAFGKNSLAIMDFQKSIELNKNNRDFIMRDCYIGLSIAYFRQDKIEDAKGNYQKAIDVEPLCKNGLDAVEKRDHLSYTPGNKQTVNEILKLFRVGKK